MIKYQSFLLFILFILILSSDVHASQPKVCFLLMKTIKGSPSAQQKEILLIYSQPNGMIIYHQLKFLMAWWFQFLKM